MEPENFTKNPKNTADSSTPINKNNAAHNANFNNYSDEQYQQFSNQNYHNQHTPQVIYQQGYHYQQYQQQPNQHYGQLNQKFNHQYVTKNQFDKRGRGRGRGKGRGQGWKHSYIHKKCPNFYKKKHSSISNSSQSQKQSSTKKMQNLTLQQMPNCKKAIKQSLQVFLEPYKLNQGPKNKIYNFMLNRFQSPQQLDSFYDIFYQLKQKHPYLENNLSLVKICKVIIKRQYQIDKIQNKLNKEYQIKQKKLNKDRQFKKKFPHPFQIQFYERQQLIQLDLKKTLFLIDCDNVMPKAKVFRDYYESRNIQQKAQAQVRLNWAVSQALPHAQIFYDYKYPPEIYQKINKQILSQRELKVLTKTPLHFADKQRNIYETADNQLVKRLHQIVYKQQYSDIDRIVIVSADRQLAQRCRQITLIQQSSGKYLFKFLKDAIKRRITQQPQMKGIIKQIFS